jgi:hypothetical protein
MICTQLSTKSKWVISVVGELQLCFSKLHVVLNWDLSVTRRLQLRFFYYTWLQIAFFGVTCGLQLWFSGCAQVPVGIFRHVQVLTEFLVTRVLQIVLFPVARELQLRFFQLCAGCNWDFFQLWKGCNWDFFSYVRVAIKFFPVTDRLQLRFSSCRLVATEIFPVAGGLQLRFFQLRTSDKLQLRFLQLRRGWNLDFFHLHADCNWDFCSYTWVATGFFFQLHVFFFFFRE